MYLDNRVHCYLIYQIYRFSLFLVFSLCLQSLNHRAIIKNKIVIITGVRAGFGKATVITTVKEQILCQQFI